MQTLLPCGLHKGVAAEGEDLPSLQAVDIWKIASITGTVGVSLKKVIVRH